MEKKEITSKFNSLSEFDNWKIYLYFYHHKKKYIRMKINFEKILFGMHFFMNMEKENGKNGINKRAE